MSVIGETDQGSKPSSSSMDPPELQNVGDTPSDMPPDPLLRAGTFIDDDKNNNIGNRETLNENRIVPGDTKVLPDINHQAVEVEVEASPVHPFSDFDDGPPGFVADNSMGPPGFEADNSMRPPGFVDDNSKGPPGFVADNSTGSPGFVADNANCLEVATPVSVTEYTASPAESRSRRGRKRKSEKMGSALIPASVSTERPAWLPPGWTIEYRVRGGGATAGLVDKYYIDPVSGHSFRSKNEVLYYIQNGKKLKKRSTDSPSAEKLTLGSSGGRKRKKSVPRVTTSVPNFDFVDVPEKVDWVFTDSSDGSWNPFIGDQEIPEFIKREWGNAFASVTV